MPAKKPPDKKRKPVAVYLTPAENDFHTEQAQKHGLERGQWLRMLIREASVNRGLKLPE